MLPLRSIVCLCFSRPIQKQKQWLLVLPKPKAFYHCRHLQTTVVPMAIRLFEGEEHAKLYAKYRPTFPDAMFEEIFKFCTSENSDKTLLNLAVDVGCGSGQSTRPLCRYFRQVIGSDVSDEQIKSAIAKTIKTETPNLEFRTGAGENLSFLEDSSTDLVTIAQALHWLDHGLFFAEVRRALKPKGVFAAYGYGLCVLNKETAQKLQDEFYTDLLGEYWDRERRHIETYFADFKFPFEPCTRIESDNIAIRRQMPLSAYIGYVSTWSAWQKYKKVHPKSDALSELHAKLHKIYSLTSDLEDPIVNAYWPGFLILCRKPE